MKFAYPQYFTDRARFMTYTVVAKALEKAGHTLTPDTSDCDAVLYSMCDVTEYQGLAKLRVSTGRPLIVGGSYAFNYMSAILYSDAVWIGEVYDMADCKTLDEIYRSPYCYTGTKKRLYASTRIDWPDVPVCQIDPKKCYYWGGVGCKNKCRFCFTSWTHQHLCNDQGRIEAAKVQAKKHKLHIMITSNEYDAGETGGTTRDMLLKDYLKVPVKASFIRCGIEFATEKSRAWAAKPVTKDMLYAAIQKMNYDNVALRLFHITGYDSIEDWDEYIDDLCQMVSKHPNKRLLHLMFNNLQYQNYTPLYTERRNINPDNYIDIKTTKAWYDRLRKYTQHVLLGAPSPFQHVACRMGVELATTREQIDYWLAMSADPVKKMSINRAYESLIDTGVLDTPQLKYNFTTGEITEV